jgi:thiosulfate reductase cytochrome b subunit
MSKSLILLKKLAHWLLLVVTVVYLLTGLGITQYRIMESLTFGLLNKSLSFNIHDNLLMPFVVLLILHIIFSIASHRTEQK